MHVEITCTKLSFNYCPTYQAGLLLGLALQLPGRDGGDRVSASHCSHPGCQLLNHCKVALHRTNLYIRRRSKGNRKCLHEMMVRRKQAHAIYCHLKRNAESHHLPANVAQYCFQSHCTSVIEPLCLQLKIQPAQLSDRSSGQQDPKGLIF